MDRRNLFAAMALTSLALPASAQMTKPPEKDAAKPGAKASPRRIAELFAATLNAHSIESFASLFDDGYRNHQFSAAIQPGPEAAKLSEKQRTIEFFKARLWGIPDLKVGIEAIIADDDMVAASFVYTGTHQANLMGVAGTGRHLRFTSCDIFSVRRGLIIEHWGMGDIAGIAAQLKS
jgi:predicted ester cyclase